MSSRGRFGSGTPAKARQGPPQRASPRHEPPLLVITHSHAPSHRAGQALWSRPSVRWRGRPLSGRRRTTLRAGWPTRVRGGVIVAGMGAGCAGDVAQGGGLPPRQARTPRKRAIRAASSHTSGSLRGVRAGLAGGYRRCRRRSGAHGWACAGSATPNGVGPPRTRRYLGR